VGHDHDLNFVLVDDPARAVGEYWAALDAVAAQQLAVAVDPGEKVMRGGLEPRGRTRIDCLVLHLWVNRAGVGVGGFTPGVALPPPLVVLSGQGPTLAKGVRESEDTGVQAVPVDLGGLEPDELRAGVHLISLGGFGAVVTLPRRPA